MKGNRLRGARTRNDGSETSGALRLGAFGKGYDRRLRSGGARKEVPHPFLPDLPGPAARQLPPAAPGLRKRRRPRDLLLVKSNFESIVLRTPAEDSCGAEISR